MTETELKKWIDEASYEDLLRKWRNAPAGDKFFFGDMGVYFEDAMKSKRAEVGDAEHTRASRSIGWTGT